jgi:hypothetical protein
MTATANPIHCNCNGTGQYVVDDGMGSATHLCACRLKEPLRRGEVAWWTCETVGDGFDFESMTKQHQLYASITRERPVSRDNHKLLRTIDNVYWPVMADIEGELSPGSWTSDMLRDFAAWLTKVADEVDRIEAEELEPEMTATATPNTSRAAGRAE